MSRAALLGINMSAEAPCEIAALLDCLWLGTTTMDYLDGTNAREADRFGSRTWRGKDRRGP